jgi:DNA-binding GntR family transcriptional regulator
MAAHAAAVIVMRRSEYNMPQAEGSSGATLSYQTYERLRGDIVSACFSPGQKLRTRALCERYGVGLAPLREALTRLSREGLVVQSDRQGFSVPEFGEAHLEEITRTRVWLNSIALRASMEFGDSDWKENLLLAYHRLTQLPRYIEVEGELRANDQWESAHTKFHSALIAGCRSSMLIDYCSQMFEAANYYRRYSRISPGIRVVRETEHDRIFKAIQAGDTDNAVSLLCAHFTGTAAKVLERMAIERQQSVSTEQPKSAIARP